MRFWCRSRGNWCWCRCSFNSLYEIQLVEKVAESKGITFNSLYEIRREREIGKRSSETWLSILSMRFSCDEVHVRGWKLSTSFNSLYEILRRSIDAAASNRLRLSILSMRFSNNWWSVGWSIMAFQFSLWDSECEHVEAASYKSFNSLYEIPLERSSDTFTHRFTFNSLYEILRIEIDPLIRVISIFQFSLWDS